MTESHVYVADQLFATLDPTLRYIHLDQLGDIECSNLRKLTEFETQPVPETVS